MPPAKHSRKIDSVVSRDEPDHQDDAEGNGTLGPAETVTPAVNSAYGPNGLNDCLNDLSRLDISELERASALMRIGLVLDSLAQTSASLSESVRSNAIRLLSHSLEQRHGWLVRLSAALAIRAVDPLLASRPPVIEQVLAAVIIPLRPEENGRINEARKDLACICSGDPDPVGSLRQIATRANDRIAVHAAWTMWVVFGYEESRQWLLEMFEAIHPLDDREHALSYLIQAESQSPFLTDGFIRSFEQEEIERNLWVRATGRLAEAAQGRPAMVIRWTQVLLRGLKRDDSTRTRCYSCLALGLLQMPDCLPSLHHLFVSDRVDRVQVYAGIARLLISSREIIDIVTRFTTDSGIHQALLKEASDCGHALFRDTLNRIPILLESIPGLMDVLNPSDTPTETQSSGKRLSQLLADEVQLRARLLALSKTIQDARTELLATIISPSVLWEVYKSIDKANAGDCDFFKRQMDLLLATQAGVKFDTYEKQQAEVTRTKVIAGFYELELLFEGQACGFQAVPTRRGRGTFQVRVDGRTHYARTAFPCFTVRSVTQKHVESTEEN